MCVSDAVVMSPSCHVGVAATHCPAVGLQALVRYRAGDHEPVTVAFKVSPAFKASPMKRPTVTDAADKKYNTASTFVDVGSVPDYSCTFPFRVPEGTKLKALQLESASLDLASLDK